MDTKIEQLLEREDLSLASLQARIVAYILDLCILGVAISFIFWEELIAIQVALDSGKILRDMMATLTLWVFVFYIVY